MSDMMFESRRILVVDDHADIHRDFDKILGGATAAGSTAALEQLEQLVLGDATATVSRDAYELTHAHQGEQGLALLREARAQGRPFCAAFVDMRMPPGWDGLRTIEEIRKVDEDVTVVLCTAFTDHSWEQITERVKQLDKLLILKKPFDPVEVQSMARSLCERWSLLRQAHARREELEGIVAARTSELQAERAKDQHRMAELEAIVAERTKELRRMAMNDRLTGLPNRVQFHDRLLHAIERHQREQGRPYAVMFIDFDRFKVINDSLGHEFGDRLLGAISQRLSGLIGSDALLARTSSPLALAARLGGDEFCILVEGFDREQAVINLAGQALEALAKPYDLLGHRVTSTASIGITFSRFGYRNAEDVLRDADTAMYVAKAQARGTAVVFDPAMHERAMRRLVLENDLRSAIDRGQMQVWYQPIVSLETRQAIGAEALLRWNHPVHGMISPLDFIPLAEETGLIEMIGRWVFEHACRQLAGLPNLQYVSVNFSRRQFRATDFFGRLDATIRETGVDPRRVACEVTESALTHDAELVQRSVDQLRSRGLRVYLDDFGTGLSSLGSLRRIALDGIKLDRSFLDDRVFSRRTAAVIHSTTTLARDLGMQLIVEGVESLEQVAILQALACEAAQGYLFSRPVPAAELAGVIGAPVPLPTAPVTTVAA